jgi:hypothetical protein
VQKAEVLKACEAGVLKGAKRRAERRYKRRADKLP